MSSGSEGGCGGGQLPPEEVGGIFLSEEPLCGSLDDLDELIGPGGALQNRSAAPPDCVYRQPLCI